MRVLLTGASGFLGRELYSRLEEKGWTVYGLSRHGPDLFGDITKWHFGIETLPDVDVLVHCAALVSFSPKKRAELFSINTDATHAAISLCLEGTRRRLNHSPRIPHLVYISTAYVCGNCTSGPWGEQDLFHNSGFKNYYEHSKYLAEQLVREFSLRKRGPTLTATVFRPSILVGRAEDGKATNFEGFYGPVRALARVSTLVEQRLGLPRRERVEAALHLPRLPVPVTIRGDPEGTLNLVPVDWAAQRIIDLIEPTSQFRTFHLTNPQPPTNRDICSWVCDELGIAGPHFNSRAKLLQPHDRLYARMIRDFSPYLRGEPEFASSVNHDLSGVVSNEDLVRHAVRYWRETRLEEEHGTQARRGEVGATAT